MQVELFETLHVAQYLKETGTQSALTIESFLVGARRRPRLIGGGVYWAGDFRHEGQATISAVAGYSYPPLDFETETIGVATLALFPLGAEHAFYLGQFMPPEPEPGEEEKGGTNVATA